MVESKKNLNNLNNLKNLKNLKNKNFFSSLSLPQKRIIQLGSFGVIWGHLGSFSFFSL